MSAEILNQGPDDTSAQRIFIEGYQRWLDQRSDDLTAVRAAEESLQKRGITVQD